MLLALVELKLYNLGLKQALAFMLHSFMGQDMVEPEVKACRDFQNLGLVKPPVGSSHKLTSPQAFYLYSGYTHFP